MTAEQFPIGELITGIDLQANEEDGKLMTVTLALGNGGNVQFSTCGDGSSLYMRVVLPDSLTVMA